MVILEEGKGLFGTVPNLCMHAFTTHHISEGSGEVAVVVNDEDFHIRSILRRQLHELVIQFAHIATLERLKIRVPNGP